MFHPNKLTYMIADRFAKNSDYQISPAAIWST